MTEHSPSATPEIFVPNDDQQLGSDESMQLRVSEMLTELKRAPAQMLPSKYWQELNSKNRAQLASEGYRNFKRTLALNYFTWVVTRNDTQLGFLLRSLPWYTLIADTILAILSQRHSPMNVRSSKSYTLLTRLLWDYVASIDKQGLLEKLTEPLEGNPPRVFRRGRLITQDLANSVLEYRSVFESVASSTQVKTVLELGPGYGRTAFVMLSLRPNIRYILVDIPPALAVSERYLANVFSGKKVFKFRPFKKYDEVSAELEQAQIVFLLPHQLELLPDRSVDLFVNISSLHEMRIDQIEYYFGILRRVVSKYFYFKQWKESFIPYENVTIRESDYPIPADWKKIYWRTCAVQERFFEAFFELPSI